MPWAEDSRARASRVLKMQAELNGYSEGAIDELETFMQEVASDNVSEAELKTRYAWARKTMGAGVSAVFDQMKDFASSTIAKVIAELIK
jgi:hypothetical protein